MDAPSPSLAQRVTVASGWHVSPAVDVIAYHFSWLVMLVPLLLMGDRHPQDYMLLFALTLGANVAHQALTLPFVYLEPEVRATHGLRVVIVPALLAVACAGSFLAARHASPFYVMAIQPIAIFAYAWNFWHVYMQKYGLLRMYDAKSGAATRVPGWVDRLLVFSWLPLTILVVGPRHRDFLLEHFRASEAGIRAVLAAADATRPVTLPLAILLPAASLALFAWHEWRAHGLRSIPRLSMGLGMTGLSVSLLAVNPIKAVIAFGFSHVLEYIVFAWAWKRRQATVHPTRSRVLAWSLRNPLLAFGGFCAVVAGAHAVLSEWSHWISPGSKPLVLLGYPVGFLIGVSTLYLSMVHFWLDGFLWKMRRPEVRAGI